MKLKVIIIFIFLFTIVNILNAKVHFEDNRLSLGFIFGGTLLQNIPLPNNYEFSDQFGIGLNCHYILNDTTLLGYEFHGSGSIYMSGLIEDPGSNNNEYLYKADYNVFQHDIFIKYYLFEYLFVKSGLGFVKLDFKSNYPDIDPYFQKRRSDYGFTYFLGSGLSTGDLIDEHIHGIFGIDIGFQKYFNELIIDNTSSIYIYGGFLFFFNFFNR